jgi:hypothetical protein
VVGLHTVPGPPPTFEIMILEYLRLAAAEPPTLTQPEEPG